MLKPGPFAIKGATKKDLMRKALRVRCLKIGLTVVLTARHRHRAGLGYVRLGWVLSNDDRIVLQ